MDLLTNYGLFLAKTVTVVLAVAVIMMMGVNAAQRRRQQAGRLKLTDLTENYREMKEQMLLARVERAQQKQWLKARKKEQKQEAKTRRQQKKGFLNKPSLYVIDFKGGIEAGEVASLREEISAVLSVAQKGDEVLLRLESPGGVVHGYGLAASQLQRLRQKAIPLTVAVDKVAASGGYMMACVANQIVAAPFAIIGSIGVVAQIPNFNRLLKRNDIDVELHTAGEYKRTLTLFGENTQQGREKFREDLNETHTLFKQFVYQMRPNLDINAVATGEHWFGTQALKKGLVDSLNTSDDVIISKMTQFNVIEVHYARRKKWLDRFTQTAATGITQSLLTLWQRNDKPFL